MATSPAIASLSRCADRIQKYLALQDAVAPGAAMVACADRLASDLQTLLDMAAAATAATDMSTGSQITHVLATNAGLESVVAAEVSSVAGAGLIVPRPFGVPGYVGVGGLPSGGEERLQNLRSIHVAMHFHAHFTLSLPPGGGSQQENAQVMLAQLSAKVVGDVESLSAVLQTGKSFRVRCERMGGLVEPTEAQDRVGVGEHKEQAGETFWGAAKVKVISHGFQSHEVERQVGAALHDKYGLRADMKHFDVCVRVDVVGEHVLVSSMGNTEMLSKRHKLAFVRSVTLKPNVAFAMLQLAAIQPGQALLDPFAGGGTIPLEAAAVLESAAPQSAPQGALFHGCDKSGAVVEGATANARAAGVADRVVFQLSNARGLERTYPGVLFDCIVTNPPWGLRVGKDADLEKIYKGFLYSAARVVKPGGRLVFVVQRCEMVLDIVRRCGLYRIVSLTAIKTGDQVPTIFVLENLVRDALREALKAQVRVLVPLCNSAQKPTAASTAAAAAASAAAPGAAPVDRAEDDRETGSGQTAMGGTDGTG